MNNIISAVIIAAIVSAIGGNEVVVNNISQQIDANCAPAQLVISEVCYNPTTFIHDENLSKTDMYTNGKWFKTGDAFEYIEIYNMGDTKLNLEDYTLSYGDRNESPFKWYENEFVYDIGSKPVIAAKSSAILLIYSSASAKYGYKYETQEQREQFWDAFAETYSVKVPKDNRAILATNNSGSDEVKQNSFDLSNTKNDEILRIVRKSDNTVMSQVEYNAEKYNCDGTAIHFSYYGDTGKGELLGQAGCSPMTVRTMQLSKADELTQAQGTRIKLLDWNIAFSNSLGTDKVTIDTRSGVLFDRIDECDPDVIAFQEVNYIWYPKLFDNLKDYTGVGVSGKGTQNGSGDDEKDLYNIIFFKADKYALIDSGNFNLSATPDVAGSKSWNDNNAPADVARVLTWVKLKDKDTGKQFMVFNTHFVSWNERGLFTRTYCVNYLKDKLPQMAEKLPFFFTGDLNTREGYPQYVTLQKSGFEDVRYVARQSMLLGTMNGFVVDGSFKKSTIDYVWKYGKNLDIQTYKIINKDNNGVFASDHNGLFVEAYIN